MIITFLAIYLSKNLNFSTEEIGNLYILYGFGSILGSYFGGILSDKIGAYKTIIFSLLLASVSYFLSLYATTYLELTVVMLSIGFFHSSYRPANDSAIIKISTYENRTKAFALNRLAINLGQTIGPGIGGYLAVIGFHWLFIVDGVTSFLAAIMLLIYLNESKVNSNEAEPQKNTGQMKVKIANKKKFIFFLVLSFLWSLCFFQCFNTIPLYFERELFLSEDNIGLIFMVNGLIIILFEMIISHFSNKSKTLYYSALGSFYVAIAFFLIALNQSLVSAYLFIIVITFGEIYSMPFMASYASKFATEKTRGKIMSYYTLSFSFAFAIAAKIGFKIESIYGFSSLWLVMFITMLFVSYGFFFLYKKEKAVIN